MVLPVIDATLRRPKALADARTFPMLTLIPTVNCAPFGTAILVPSAEMRPVMLSRIVGARTAGTTVLFVNAAVGRGDKTI